MTNKITITGVEVRVNDHIYNGPGTNAHPTFAWETVTEVRHEDGLIVIITGNAKGAHGEIWLEPDETIVVIRYPVSAAAETPPGKSKGPHGSS
jgi:ribosomal protein L24